MSDPLNLATTAMLEPHGGALRAAWGYDPAAALRTARAATGGQRPPDYGSPEWAALPDDHPGKHAAVLHAAECWRRYWAPDMLDLRAEATERDLQRRHREMSWDLSEGRDWRRAATAPNHAELDQRRAQPPAMVSVACVEPGCGHSYRLPTHLTRAPGRPAPRCWHHSDAVRGEVA